MTLLANSFPLDWPIQYPRTLHPLRSDFKTNFTKARDEIYKELRLMKVHVLNSVISTNCAISKKTGLPSSPSAQPKDPGVSVYFVKKETTHVLCCDKWDRIEDNMHAIALTIEAMRGMERWGVTEMLERAISGFKMIEAPKRQHDDKEWFEILGVNPNDSIENIEQIYRLRMKKAHPDAGGSHELTSKLNYAISIARILRKVA